jgi:hypothetical protein
MVDKSSRVGWVEECWRSLFAGANATRWQRLRFALMERNNPTALGCSCELDYLLTERLRRRKCRLIDERNFVGCVGLSPHGEAPPTFFCLVRCLVVFLYLLTERLRQEI